MSASPALVQWKASGYGLIVAFKAANEALVKSAAERSHADEWYQRTRMGAAAAREAWSSTSKLDTFDPGFRKKLEDFELHWSATVVMSKDAWDWAQPFFDQLGEFGAFASCLQRFHESRQKMTIIPSRETVVPE